MKELITGANRGFIGSKLAEQLEHQGHEVRRFTIEDWAHLKDVLSTFNPQRIFHLAAYGNHFNQADIGEMIQANIMKTFSLLEATNQMEYEAFILFGSSSEYGRKSSPMKEEDVLEPETFYAATKCAATLLARVWAKQFNKPIVVIRPFSIFGEGEATHRFIPTVIRSCLIGEPMSLDPEASHDWLYVSDLIRGVLMVAQKAKQLKGEVINFGSGKQTTNEQIVRIIEKVCGKKANVVEKKRLRPYDTTSWVADISKAKSLGWEPEISLEEGIKRTVKYYEGIIT